MIYYIILLINRRFENKIKKKMNRCMHACEWIYIDMIGSLRSKSSDDNHEKEGIKQLIS